MNRLALAGAMAVATILVACGSGSTGPRATATPSPPTAIQTEIAVATPDLTVAATYDDTPVVAVTATAGGERMLTDLGGLTLYVRKDDVPASGISQCNGSCATQWPPVTIEFGKSFQIAGLGVFGSFRRGDGSRQLLYRGRPLYRYAGDTAPGDTKGAGIDGIWSVAVP